MKKILILTSMLFFAFSLFSQEDSAIVQNDTITAVAETTVASEEIPLLPDRMLPTQRLLWGRKGLMRNFKTFELSPDERLREMEIRGTMLRFHRAAGFITAAGLMAESVVGILLYNGYNNLGELHEGLAAGVNVGYGTTLALAFFTPPSLKNPKKGVTGLKAHKALALLHISGMIATNVIAGLMENNRDLVPFHAAAAGTAYVSLVASIIVVRF